MGHFGCKFSLFGILSLIASSLLFVSAGHVDAQGQYSPVTDADVISLKLNHYFTLDKKSHDPDFEWTFTKTEFVLKKGKNAIPGDLLKKLLPAGTAAEEIRGKWKLQDKDGQQLVLTEIKAGEKAGNKDVSLIIAKTAPTVVRIGETQYVFGVGK